MTTTLYYFTGTGNSLAVARSLAEHLGDTRLVSIPAVMGGDGEIPVLSKKIGIICPVYDAGVPILVREFLHRCRFHDASYLFAIVTMAGIGGSALRMIDQDLREGNGRGLDAGFIVKMPGNFPPLSVPPAGKKIESLLKTAEQEVGAAAGIIREGSSRRIGMYPLSSLMQAALFGPFSRKVREADEKFTVSAACNGCGTCVSVCPVKNVTLRDGRPVYHHHCELCCGCLNFCPVQAIDLDMFRGSRGRGRYHHPFIRVDDMQRQQGDGTVGQK